MRRQDYEKCIEDEGKMYPEIGHIIALTFLIRMRLKPSAESSWMEPIFDISMFDGIDQSNILDARKKLKILLTNSYSCFWRGLSIERALKY